MESWWTKTQTATKQEGGGENANKNVISNVYMIHIYQLTHYAYLHIRRNNVALTDFFFYPMFSGGG